MNKCISCNREYMYNRNSGGTKQRCNSCLVNDRRFKLRIKIHNFMGKKCSKCGFSGVPQQFDCHHLEKDKKDFTISGSHCKSWNKLIEELKKCIYLCVNCHRLVHYLESRSSSHH